MDGDRQSQRGAHAIPSWFVLAVAIIALVLGAVALTATLTNRSSVFPMMGGNTGMLGTRSAVSPPNGPRPGEAGFVAGTATAPRVIRVIAGPGYRFSPSAVIVARNETITFEVTTMGPTAHEFMVGPADAVAADQEGTPEVADIAMMQTKTLTYTFDGAGPYAFACHVAGHYEAGMRGSITIVPAE